MPVDVRRLIHLLPVYTSVQCYVAQFRQIVNTKIVCVNYYSNRIALLHAADDLE